MSRFLEHHPFVSLVMFGLFCATIIQTADVVANGTRVEHILPKKKETTDKQEPVKEQ
jgi:hypothetical protein